MKDKKISKEIMGAISAGIILSLLKKKTSYGYEIMAEVRKLSGGLIIWKDGSLYPVLKKLEKEKLIKSYWIFRDNERPRKYYKILAKGHRALDNFFTEWEFINNMLSEI